MSILEVLALAYLLTGALYATYRLIRTAMRIPAIGYSEMPIAVKIGLFIGVLIGSLIGFIFTTLVWPIQVYFNGKP